MINTEGKRKAKKSYLHFLPYIKDDLVSSEFLRVLSKALQKFIVNVIKGKRPKLLLQAPPQHGKSFLAAEAFPAWALGVNPDFKIAVATYGFSLAKKRNLNIQRIIGEDTYSNVFPNTKLNLTTKRDILGAPLRGADEFEVVGFRGGVRVVGVGGGLTGFPVDIGIIDDPYKDRKEARSSTVNEGVIEWYQNVFKTRLSKNSGTILMLTRWTDEDLAGWILENEEGWEEIRFKGIIDEGTKNERALVPKLHPLDKLLETKKGMAKEIWEAMYQQSPIIEGGNIIKTIWFKTYIKLPDTITRVFITSDTAQKTKEANDYTVMAAWAVDSNRNIYLLDLYRAKLEAPDLEDAAKRFWDRWVGGVSGRPCTHFYIEDKSSGTGLIQYLKYKTSIPVMSVERVIDKYSRLLDVLPHIKNGKVFLPHNAEWLKVFIDECKAFSADLKHKQDDQVDVMIDGINIGIGLSSVSILDVI